MSLECAKPVTKSSVPCARQSKNVVPLTLNELAETLMTVFRVAVPSDSAERPVTSLKVDPAG